MSDVKNDNLFDRHLTDEQTKVAVDEDTLWRWAVLVNFLNILEKEQLELLDVDVARKRLIIGKLKNGKNLTNNNDNNLMFNTLVKLVEELCLVQVRISPLQVEGQFLVSI
ncbi:MAG: hypothetical protein ACFFD4_17170 [Candidatus Odinarchaeota archaeon]